MASISDRPVVLKIVFLADSYQTLSESRTESITFAFLLTLAMSTANGEAGKSTQDLYPSLDIKSIAA